MELITKTDTLKGVDVFDSNTITYRRTIGDGSYGDVHIGHCSKDREYVIKQNFIDKRIDLIGSVKEIDLLIKLKGHPYIVGLRGISIGNPFTEQVERRNPHKSHKSDQIFFLYDRALSDMYQFIHLEQNPVHLKKLAMVQFLLGLEYMHSKGIIHRDLKPSNLLWTRPKSGIRLLQIADFGLSKPMCNQEPSTPRVVTIWFRAPEISLMNDIYTDKADIWSAACIMFETMTGRPLINISSKSEIILLRHILGIIPHSPDKETLKKMDVNNLLKNYKSRSRQRDFDSVLKFSDKYKEEFMQVMEEDKKQVDAYEAFKDILGHMLEFDPEQRYSATQALDHPFCDPFQDLIQLIREKYPPVPPKLPTLYIYDLLERKWAFNVAIRYFNNQHNHNWYKHQILFLALDMFDRYLDHLVKTPKRPYFLAQYTRDLEDTIQYGKYHDEHTTELYFYVCLYLAYKYYHVMTPGIPFKQFVLKNFSISSKTFKIAEQFELYLLQQIFDFNIFSPTLLNAADRIGIRLTLDQIRSLLIYYSSHYCSQGLDSVNYLEDFLKTQSYPSELK